MNTSTKQWLMSVFSEDNANPPQGSSSRALSFILSIGSLAIITVLFARLPYLPADKLAAFLPSLPYIIGGLTAFSISPYTVNKVSGIWDKSSNSPTTPPVPPAPPSGS
jgi:hypothetical protein